MTKKPGNAIVNGAGSLQELRQRAEQGDADAQFGYGKSFDRGKDTTANDRTEAKMWFRKAAEQGHVDAQYALGHCLDLAFFFDGELNQQDIADVPKWFRKAAEQGHVRAQYALGFLCASGDGIPQNMTEAAQWYRKAAEQGDARAQYALGLLCASGDGIPQNMTEAIKWYQKAAKQGNADAIKALEQQSKEREASHYGLQLLYDELATLIGLDLVKKDVLQFVSFLKVQQLRSQRGFDSAAASRHLVFTGNPGTGKTTVARILAKIYRHLGFLSRGQLIETDRTGLIAQYLGQTGEKTKKLIESALGGVLFIDEAYSLANDSRDSYGQEAMDVLVKMMEDHREDLVVIVAGYKDEMARFLDANPGMKSRFNTYIAFKDYSPAELVAIFKVFCKKYDYVLSRGAEIKLNNLFSTLFLSRPKNFSNARFARNLFEKSLTNQAARIETIPDKTDEVLNTIEADDIPGPEYSDAYC